MRLIGLVPGYQFGKTGIRVPLRKQALIVDFFENVKGNSFGKNGIFVMRDSF